MQLGGVWLRGAARGVQLRGLQLGCVAEECCGGVQLRGAAEGCGAAAACAMTTPATRMVRAAHWFMRRALPKMTTPSTAVLRVLVW